MTLEELHCHFVRFALPDIQVLCDGSTMDHFGVLVQREWIACLADAIRERNALRQRIESARMTTVRAGINDEATIYQEELPPSWIGKRVRLVVETDDNG